MRLTHDSPTPELLSTSASLPVSECSCSCSLSVPDDAASCFCFSTASCLGCGGGGWAAAAARGGRTTRGGTGKRAFRTDARKYGMFKSASSSNGGRYDANAYVCAANRCVRVST